jgi:hypothetical protein
VKLYYNIKHINCCSGLAAYSLCGLGEVEGGTVIIPAYLHFLVLFQTFSRCYSMSVIQFNVTDSFFVNMEFIHLIDIMTFSVGMKNLHDIFNLPKGFTIL